MSDGRPILDLLVGLRRAAISALSGAALGLGASYTAGAYGAMALGLAIIAITWTLDHMRG
jgi:hypothetical protein